MPLPSGPNSVPKSPEADQKRRARDENYRQEEKWLTSSRAPTLSNLALLGNHDTSLAAICIAHKAGSVLEEGVTLDDPSALQILLMLQGNGNDPQDLFDGDDPRLLIAQQAKTLYDNKVDILSQMNSANYSVPSDDGGEWGLLDRMAFVLEDELKLFQSTVLEPEEEEAADEGAPEEVKAEMDSEVQVIVNLLNQVIQALVGRDHGRDLGEAVAELEAQREEALADVEKFRKKWGNAKELVVRKHKTGVEIAGKNRELREAKRAVERDLAEARRRIQELTHKLNMSKREMGRLKELILKHLIPALQKVSREHAALVEALGGTLRDGDLSGEERREKAADDDGPGDEDRAVDGGTDGEEEASADDASSDEEAPETPAGAPAPSQQDDNPASIDDASSDEEAPETPAGAPAQQDDNSPADGDDWGGLQNTRPDSSAKGMGNDKGEGHSFSGRTGDTDLEEGNEEGNAGRRRAIDDDDPPSGRTGDTDLEEGNVNPPDRPGEGEGDKRRYIVLPPQWSNDTDPNSGKEAELKIRRTTMVRLLKDLGSGSTPAVEQGSQSSQRTPTRNERTATMSLPRVKRGSWWSRNMPYWLGGNRSKKNK